MTDAILIRSYRPQEAARLLEIFRGAVRSAGARDYDAAQVAAWASAEIDAAAWAARRVAKPTYVAERSGEVAGFIDLEPDGHIDMLYVDAAHQRRGVASALIGHVEGLARIAGLARLYTEASLTARPVFARRGFMVLASQTVRTRGQSFVNLRMEKRLGA